ncbi:hypothetical protein ACFO0M_04705 [Micromonospora mangrovi]|uniref:Uncharacterized protein n=2 Tax=Micromonospora TaxID=1873 RepID=A0AAU8H6B1_9ACTN
MLTDRPDDVEALCTLAYCRGRTGDHPGLLCRRAWRRQPAAVRWRLRAERRSAAVALRPVLVLAATVALTVGACPPSADGAAEASGQLALTLTAVTLAVRLRNLLARQLRAVLVRLGHRAGLAVHEGRSRLRGRRPAPPPTAARG